MSRHIPRRDRWVRYSSDQHRSVEGLTARLYKGEWWAEVAYQLLVEDEPGVTRWEPHADRLGPYRRPRNAMVEAERHLTRLRNQHGERVRLEPPA
jgi:hypothetical protein